MTVRELIIKLSQMSQDAQVLVRDDNGDAFERVEITIEENKTYKTVTIVGDE